MHYLMPSLPMVWVLIAAPVPALAEMPEPDQVEAAGAEFPYVAAGAGEPVLFVHGSLVDYRVWAGLWDDVARDHRIVAYTQRWFGTKDWPEDKSFSRDIHTADLVALLKTWGEPMHLVGWSYGGAVVLDAASKVPELVSSIVVFEPTVTEIVAGNPEAEAAREEWFGLWGETVAAVEAKDYEGSIREAAEAAFGLGKGGFSTIDADLQTTMLENAHVQPLDLFAAEPSPITCEALKKVTAPTLLIVGSETARFWDLSARMLAACIPGAEVAVLDGVGHGGPVQAQDAFVNLTLGFIDR